MTRKVDHNDTYSTIRQWAVIAREAQIPGKGLTEFPTHTAVTPTPRSSGTSLSPGIFSRRLF